jgi:hypothetical protein
MSPGRLQRVNELLTEARSRDPAERRALLMEACAGDHQLREEVESLLAQDSTGRGEGIPDRHR